MVPRVHGSLFFEGNPSSAALFAGFHSTPGDTVAAVGVECEELGCGII